jgi:phosphoheptose isomerase
VTDVASVRRHLAEAAAEQARLVGLGDLAEQVAAAANVITERLRGGGKLLAFGNGGGAADAEHFVAELVGRFERDRRAFAAVALTANSSSVTAIANDLGFEQVFARQVEALGVAGDVAVGFSTSGESENVAAGLRAARERSLTTVAFTGATPGSVVAAADHVIMVESMRTPRIQEVNMVLVHVLCAAVEQALTGGPG